MAGTNLTVENSVLSGNQAGSGCYQSAVNRVTDVTLTMRNSTVKNNVAANNGTINNPMRMESCTIVGNQGAFGGGVVMFNGSATHSRFFKTIRIHLIISILFNEHKELGRHFYSLNAERLSLSSGVYFYTMKTSGCSQTKK